MEDKLRRHVFRMRRQCDLCGSKNRTTIKYLCFKSHAILRNTRMCLGFHAAKRSLTCPRGSLRNTEEVTSDLPRSETNILVQDHGIATLCYSVKSKKEKKSRRTHETHRANDSQNHYKLKEMYLVGMITVIGTLNRGPEVGDVVSNPQT